MFRQKPSFFERAFISSASSTTAAVEGIRALGCIAVLIRHCVIFAGLLFSSQEPLISLISDRTTVAGFVLGWADQTLVYWVDVFMFLSAFLMSPKLIPALSSNAGRFRHVLLYIISRYLRLAPLYILYSYITKAFGRVECVSGPELLLVSNFFQEMNDNCIITGWSTNLDMQLHIMLLLLATTQHSTRALERMLFVVTILCTLYGTLEWIRADRPYWAPGYSLREYMTPDPSVGANIAQFFGVPAPAPQSATETARYIRTAAFNVLYTEPIRRIASVATGALVRLQLDRRAPLVRAVQSRPVRAVAFNLAALVLLLSGDEVLKLWPRKDNYEGIAFAAVHYTLRVPLCLSVVAVTLVLSAADGKNGSIAGRAFRSVLGCTGARIVGRAVYGVSLGQYALVAVVMPAWRLSRPETQDARVLAAWMVQCVGVLIGVLAGVSVVSGVVEQVCLDLRARLMRRLQLLDYKCAAFLKSEDMVPRNITPVERKKED